MKLKDIHGDLHDVTPANGTLWEEEIIGSDKNIYYYSDDPSGPFNFGIEISLAAYNRLLELGAKER